MSHGTVPPIKYLPVRLVSLYTSVFARYMPQFLMLPESPVYFKCSMNNVITVVASLHPLPLGVRVYIYMSLPGPLLNWRAVCRLQFKRIKMWRFLLRMLFSSLQMLSVKIESIGCIWKYEEYERIFRAWHSSTFPFSCAPSYFNRQSLCPTRERIMQ